MTLLGVLVQEMTKRDGAMGAMTACGERHHQRAKYQHGWCHRQSLCFGASSGLRL